jgi:hypothetical protein
VKVCVFLQSEFLPDVRALEIENATNVAKLRDRLMEVIPAGIDPPTVGFYLEDSDDELILEELAEIPDGLRVHLHRLRGIDVAVRYAGRQVQRTFRPSATIRRVKHWAVREFKISHSDAAELMLQIAGTDQRPDADTHIGALVIYPQKSLCLDLVPSARVNG